MQTLALVALLVPMAHITQAAAQCAPAPAQSFRCYIPQYRPDFDCVGTNNATRCQGYNTFDSLRACCRPGTAFKDGV